MSAEGFTLFSVPASLRRRDVSCGNCRHFESGKVGPVSLSRTKALALGFDPESIDEVVEEVKVEFGLCHLREEETVTRGFCVGWSSRWWGWLVHWGVVLWRRTLRALGRQVDDIDPDAPVRRRIKRFLQGKPRCVACNSLGIGSAVGNGATRLAFIVRDDVAYAARKVFALASGTGAGATGSYADLPARCHGCQCALIQQTCAAVPGGHVNFEWAPFEKAHMRRICSRCQWSEVKPRE